MSDPVVQILLTAVVICAVVSSLVWQVLRPGRATAFDQRDGSHRFLGGVIFNATGGAFTGLSSLRRSASKPFAQLVIGERSVTCSLPGTALARFVGLPTETSLRYDEIDRVDAKFGVRFVKPALRFHTVEEQDDRDGLVFLPYQRDYREILDRLRRAGVRLV